MYAIISQCSLNYFNFGVVVVVLSINIYVQPGLGKHAKMEFRNSVKRSHFNLKETA